MGGGGSGGQGWVFHLISQGLYHLDFLSFLHVLTLVGMPAFEQLDLGCIFGILIELLDRLPLQAPCILRFSMAMFPVKARVSLLRRSTPHALWQFGRGLVWKRSRFFVCGLAGGRDMFGSL